MPRPTHLLLVCSLLTLCTLSLALGQEVRKEPSNRTQIVTASVASDGVRIAAPSALVQLRLEVYDDAGQKLLDTEQRGGNLIDWHLQGGAGERVADGTYLCVVTVKNPSGRLSQKLGLVTVSAQSTRLRPAGIAELSQRQAQVVGPIEGEDVGLTVMPAEDAQPVTVLAHTGDQAQLTRTRGALSFRVGDFFSANDKEQMRLTEEGNLGIGTAKPKVKLDVAGMIRAREGFLFSNGSALNVNDKGALTLTNSDGSLAPNLAGTGTQNGIAKWTDSAGTLGDSGISEVGGLVGIGTTSPFTNLHLNQPVGAGTSKGLLLSGDEYFQSGNGANNAGVLLLLGVNRPGNRQLWIGDRSSLGSSTNGFFRIQSGAYNSMDAVTGNGLTRLPLNLGTDTSNVGVGFNDFTAGGPGAKLSVAGNLAVGTSFKSSAAPANGLIVQGNVGVGTNNPSAKLEVAGNVKLSGTGSSLMFPDGSSMTTAASGGTPSGTNIVSAVNDPATVGTIGDARLSANVARLNSANTFAGNQNVTGNVTATGSIASNSGGFRFPDGSVQTTAAASGGTMSGTSIVNAVNDPATTGTINDARLSANLPRLNSANTFGASQSVNGNVTATGTIAAGGRVESNSGGFKFPDATVQTTAADKVYTTFPLFSVEIAAPGATSSISELTLPAGSYMVTASVQFENRGLFNKRLVACQLVDEGIWFARIEGSGGSTDYVPVTLHTVINHGGTIRLYCQAIDGGSGHSNIFASGRRLTAVRIGDLVTQ